MELRAMPAVDQDRALARAGEKLGVPARLDYVRDMQWKIAALWAWMYVGMFVIAVVVGVIFAIRS